MDNLQKPLISVIMPAYNAARFVHEAIASVFAQTYPHWELLVIDDASDDGTSEIIASFQGDSRIRSLRVARIGHPAGVRNVGLRLAQGDFIAFLDADDAYFPDTLEKFLRFFQNNPEASAVYGFAASMDEQGHRLHRYDLLKSSLSEGYALPLDYQHTWENILLARISCLLPGLMLRRETLERIGLFNEALCGPEDYEFYIRLFMDRLEGIGVLPDYLYRYRIYASSLTKSPEHYDRILRSSLAIMQWFFSQPNLSPEIRQLQSRAFTECYRYLSRERLIHRQPMLCRKLAFIALQDPNIRLTDWLGQCFPLLIRSLIPPALNSALIAMRWGLRNRCLPFGDRLCKAGIL